MGGPSSFHSSFCGLLITLFVGLFHDVLFYPILIMLLFTCMRVVMRDKKKKVPPRWYQRVDVIMSLPVWVWMIQIVLVPEVNAINWLTGLLTGGS